MVSLENLILAVLFIASAIGVTFLVFRVQKYKYAIEETTLTMKWYYMGLLPIRLKVRFDTIVDVQKIDRFFSALLEKPLSLVWGKPSRKMVLIKKNGGLFRTVIISPPEPDSFIKILRARLKQSDQRA